MAVENKPSDSDVVVPEKLRDDAIIEALCLLQFTSPEVPEIVIGRLSDIVEQDQFNLVRLPLADVPAPVRHADAGLRGQPVIELRKKDGKRIVRLSENLISYNIVGPKNYCGWTIFRKELEDVFSNLFKKLRAVEVKRIGFRYINALVKSRHFIGDVHELQLKTTIAGKPFTGPINLNLVEDDESHITTTRVAHPRFVQGMLPPNTIAVIDVEVTTPTKYTANNVEAVVGWIGDAHKHEKEAFFRLIPSDILEKLVEK